ncbi:MAG: hypothetical protein AAB403_08855, partial [Planctomycetota bacterium]
KKRSVELHLKSTFGRIVLRVTKGYYPQSQEWVVPIRKAWGLAKNQQLTPTLQRKLCCTAVETGSFEKASALATEWGCTISDDAIRSCVVSLGEKALSFPLAGASAGKAGREDVLVIMMDGWLARHRGKDWGKKRRVDGQERVNWHEIKSAVIYRLKDQAKVSPKRQALLSKHVVAVPAETDPVDFGRRVQDEAIRMGMGEARLVYVVMDGAVWLWNIFEDRFKQCAVGTLDFYHASQHLHGLADELFGENKADARTWCAQILHALKHHSPAKLFTTLAELLVDPPRQDPSTISAIESAKTYFDDHKDHMDYPHAVKADLPIGSGSMESQCSQFQNRFKRRGQFWMKQGFAGLLEVSVRHQNGELRSLWAA